MMENGASERTRASNTQIVIALVFLAFAIWFVVRGVQRSDFLLVGAGAILGISGVARLRGKST